MEMRKMVPNMPISLKVDVDLKVFKQIRENPRWTERRSQRMTDSETLELKHEIWKNTGGH